MKHWSALLLVIPLVACGGKKKEDAVHEAQGILDRGMACTDVACAKKAVDDLAVNKKSHADLKGADLTFVEDAQTRLDGKVAELEAKGKAPAPAQAAAPTAAPAGAPAPSGGAKLSRADIFYTMYAECRIAFGAPHPTPDQAATVARIQQKARDNAAVLGVTIGDAPPETGKIEEYTAAKLQFMNSFADSMLQKMDKYSDADGALVVVGFNACALWAGYQPGSQLALTASSTLMKDFPHTGLDPKMLVPLAEAVGKGVPGPDEAKVADDFMASVLKALSTEK
jgi:hypothetical protein